MRQKFFFLLRIFLGVLFIFSGFTKLVEPYQNFLAIIESYKIITGFTAKAIAILLPWVEFVAGVFLLTGLWTRWSAFVLWMLNTTFVAVVASALIRKLPIEDCGCFGDAAHSLSLSQVLWLDGALWVALALLFFGTHSASPWSLDRYFEKKHG